MTAMLRQEGDRPSLKEVAEKMSGDDFARVFAWVMGDTGGDWTDYFLMRNVLKAETLEAAARVLVAEYSEPDSVLTAARANLIREACRSLYAFQRQTEDAARSLSIMYDAKRGLSGF